MDISSGEFWVDALVTAFFMGAYGVLMYKLGRRHGRSDAVEG